MKINQGITIFNSNFLLKPISVYRVFYCKNGTVCNKIKTNDINLLTFKFVNSNSYFFVRLFKKMFP